MARPTVIQNAAFWAAIEKIKPLYDATAKTKILKGFSDERPFYRIKSFFKIQKQE